MPWNLSGSTSRLLGSRSHAHRCGNDLFERFYVLGELVEPSTHFTLQMVGSIVAKKSIQWQLMKPRVVVNEGIQAALVMFTLAMGFMKLPMMLGLWMLELVIVVALSSSFYPERGRRRAIMDVLKMIALCAFLSIFLLVMYFGAAKASMKFEPSSIVSAVAMLVLRMAMIARTAGPPLIPRSPGRTPL